MYTLRSAFRYGVADDAVNVERLKWRRSAVADQHARVVGRPKTAVPELTNDGMRTSTEITQLGPSGQMFAKADVARDDDVVELTFVGRDDRPAAFTLLGEPRMALAANWQR
jgi:hypothetical protein